MDATPWMEIAWREQGVKEIAGPEAEPAIVGYFQDAGRPDITSDEVAWCAAFVGACLARAKVPVPLPREERLLARAYGKIGTAITEPRYGAIGVFSRSGGWPGAGHVGFVVGSTPTTITLLNGNVGNAVTVTHMPRDRLLGFRWPAPPVTPGALAKAGSRTVGASRRQSGDAVKVGGTQVVEQAIPSPDPLAVGQNIQSSFGVMDGLREFAQFAFDKSPYLLGAIAAFYLARMIYDARLIAGFRAADHNEGKSLARFADQGGGDGQDL